MRLRGDPDDIGTAALAELLAPAVILSADSVFTRFGLSDTLAITWLPAAYGLLRAAGFEASLTETAYLLELAARLVTGAVRAVAGAARHFPLTAIGVAAVAVVLAYRAGYLDRAHLRTVSLQVGQFAVDGIDAFADAYGGYERARGALRVIEPYDPPTIEELAARHLARVRQPMTARDLATALNARGYALSTSELATAVERHPAFRIKGWPGADDRSRQTGTWSSCCHIVVCKCFRGGCTRMTVMGKGPGMPNDEAAVNGEDETIDRHAETDEASQNKSGSASVVSLAQAMAENGALADSIRKLTGDLERMGLFATQQAELAEQLRLNLSFIDDSAFMRVAEHAAAVNSFKLPTSVMGTLAESFRGIDRITKQDWLLSQQAVVANWTQVTLGWSALTSWRAALEAQARVSKVFAGSQPLLAAQSKLVQNLKQITAAQISLTDWAVRQDASSRLLGEISGKPLGLWRTYVDGLSTEPTQDALELSVATGEVGLGLLAADMMGSAAADTQLEPVAVEHVEAEVLEPWRQGRLDNAEQLYARLGAIDATVPELLKGAWDNVLRDGPAAASQAAYCVTEVLDRTLRAAAPDDEVRAWHRAVGRPTAEWENQDRPPRSLRVKFLAQRTGGTRKLVVAQYESLATLVQPLQARLQGVKHASTGDVALVRALLQTAECFLAMLFMTSEP